MFTHNHVASTPLRFRRLACLVISLVVVFALMGCSESQSDNQASSGPPRAEEPDLTQEQKDELLAAAVDYSRDKYGLEVVLSEVDIGGQPLPGFRLLQDGEGVSVQVLAEGEGFDQFSVVVNEGVGVRDTRQNLEIYDALCEYSWQAAGLPAPEQSWIADAPDAWLTYYDGTNIAEVCLEASGMSSSLLYAQNPGEPSEMPQGFSRIMALTVKDMEEWKSVAEPPLTSWSQNPEWTLPYLESALVMTLDKNGNPEVKCQELNEKTVCYYGSDFMNELFNVRLGDSGGLVGGSFTCKDNAPTFLDTETVMVFISTELWDKLTKGHNSIGYNVSDIGQAGIKEPMSIYPERVESLKMTSVMTFGDYHFVYASPGSQVVFFEANE